MFVDSRTIFSSLIQKFRFLWLWLTAKQRLASYAESLERRMYDKSLTPIWLIGQIPFSNKGLIHPVS